jgi:hypothetical protein
MTKRTFIQRGEPAHSPLAPFVSRIASLALGSRRGRAGSRTGRHRGAGLLAWLVALGAASGMAWLATTDAKPLQALTLKNAGTIQSTGFVQQASSLSGAFGTMLNGGLAPNLVTFDSASGTGLFNPNDGALEALNPPTQSLTPAAVTSANTWVYRSNLKVAGVGTGAATYAVDLVGIRLQACQQANNSLYGTALTLTPWASGLTAAAWNATGTAIDLSGVAGVSGKPRACVGTSDGQYVYYEVLMAQ